MCVCVLIRYLWGTAGWSRVEAPDVGVMTFANSLSNTKLVESVFAMPSETGIAGAYLPKVHGVIGR